MISLIVIPARSGSKRLKNKNKKLFLGKPLVEHTIDFAKKSNISSNILISTDDKQILKLAKKKNILAPWLRPARYSRDTSTSYSFMIHAINWFIKKFRKLDYVILLQPTTPFREIKTFKMINSIFLKQKKSVASFTLNLSKDKNIYYIKNKNKIYFKNNKNCNRSNISGSYFINSIENLKRFKTFVNKETVPIVLGNIKENIDIDTYSDYKKAKQIFENEN